MCVAGTLPPPPGPPGEIGCEIGYTAFNTNIC